MPAGPEELPASRPTTLLFHKPYGVLSQFTPEPGSRWRCLADFIAVPGVYAAGRLDADSEGLLLLTANGRLQQRLTDPAFGHWRTYWVQVEGEAGQRPEALQQLRQGVVIQGRLTRPALVRCLSDPKLPERDPPIRQRATIPVSWLELQLQEGRNRQVRRMTARVGLPTLRLIRVAIDLMDGEAPLSLSGLKPGDWRRVSHREEHRLARLLQRSVEAEAGPCRRSPGRGGRAGGGKSGQAGGGG
ncbi:ribosomal large subunit pseudouridine synthase E [Cyanobium sp. PCC 7001]|uniref:pseudouridine synthase n=1 Tax=Cyanobium sp. PCC 7001 TaxID=180281 RepID=UPI00018051F1|nr:pseudouridine synthase [Cyanobium sp. PCC 7001]EDY38856.1 ribosomal large subunit pseudouridine synthase E [Cyanobium sp. PCC 7001]